jgi:hypothetical protein
MRLPGLLAWVRAERRIALGAALVGGAVTSR